jgi:hypothetical protein
MRTIVNLNETGWLPSLAIAALRQCPDSTVEVEWDTKPYCGYDVFVDGERVCMDASENICTVKRFWEIVEKNNAEIAAGLAALNDANAQVRAHYDPMMGPQDD